MEQDGAKQRSLEQRGKVRSSAGKSGAMGRSVGRYGEVWSNLEKPGAARESSEQVRSNVEECREIWKGLEMLRASVEKGCVFISITNWSFALRQLNFYTKCRRYRSK